MAITTYAIWMQETKAGPLTPRSTELKAIDQALQQYETQGRTTKELIHLKKTLEAWIKAKGAAWKTSVRNQKGAVEKLRTEINALLVDVQLDVPLVGQKVGYDNQPLMQPNARGDLVQHGFMACWYASACMVSYYFRAGPRLGLPAVWKPDQGLTLAAINSLATIEGLVAVPKPAGGLTHDAVLDLLVEHGPIWAAGHYLDGHPRAGHAITISGVEGPFVHYNDPWEPKAKKRPAQWINSHLLNLPNALLVKNPARQ